MKASKVYSKRRAITARTPHHRSLLMGAAMRPRLLAISPIITRRLQRRVRLRVRLARNEWISERISCFSTFSTRILTTRSQTKRVPCPLVAITATNWWLAFLQWLQWISFTHWDAWANASLEKWWKNLCEAISIIISHFTLFYIHIFFYKLVNKKQWNFFKIRHWV